jgi:hypothetical protein
MFRYDSMLVGNSKYTTEANQALERNVYVRHASCGARVTPAIAVAQL